MTKASDKRSEPKEYKRRDTENSDDNCLDLPRRLVDEGEDVHHVKKRNADNASVDLKHSRETNPARLVWPGPNPSIVSIDFPIDRDLKAVLHDHKLPQPQEMLNSQYKSRPLASHGTPWRYSKTAHRCDTRRHGRSGDHQRGRRRVS